MWRVRQAAARLFLMNYTASCAQKSISQTHLLQTSLLLLITGVLSGIDLHTRHASTHSLAGGEWARIRYTALDEQPGHEMKPVALQLESPVASDHWPWPRTRGVAGLAALFSQRLWSAHCSRCATKRRTSDAV